MTDTAPTAPHPFCFGLGYSAGALAHRLIGVGWTVSGTRRPRDDEPPEGPCVIHPFDGSAPVRGGARVLDGVTHVLSSVPPGPDGDPVLAHYAETLAAMDGLQWVGYLSTTGVYGDTGGTVVDETAPLRPTSKRSEYRVRAETAWLDLWRTHGLPVHVFRLAGIYGPGRNVFAQVREGHAKRINKPGHRFSRIHVDDIAAVLLASMQRPDGGAVYNVCDDKPVPPATVTEYACRLLDLEPPPLVSFDEAARSMSPMALTFWRDNRRVDNGRIKRELGVDLRYPTYREGLRAILAQERATTARD